VNCSGIAIRKRPETYTDAEWHKVMNINLTGTFACSQAAYPEMQKVGGGKIINIGSITTTWGLGGVGVYGMTKSAVGHLTRTLAVEWAGDNIQVNCLAPGFIVTPLTEKALFGDARRRQWILDRTPARRPGKPEDLVGTLLLLTSPASDFLTGQIITVDGGFTAGGWWEK